MPDLYMVLWAVDAYTVVSNYIYRRHSSPCVSVIRLSEFSAKRFQKLQYIFVNAEHIVVSVYN